MNHKLAKIAKVVQAKNLHTDAHKSLVRAFGSDQYLSVDPFVLLDYNAYQQELARIGGRVVA